MTLTLFDSTERSRVIDLAGGGRVILHRRWLGVHQTRPMMDLLRRARWEQREMTMFGRRVLQPRLTAWWGDSGASYVYSGVRNEPQPWPDWMLNIRTILECETSASYNSCLGNYYRNGNDYVSMHADDEPELGPEPTIASLSLGAARRFKLRHDSARGIDLMLEDGDLLVMSGPMQREWTHGVPKMKCAAARANLTFRLVEAG